MEYKVKTGREIVYKDKAAKRYRTQGNGRKLAKAVKGTEYRVKGRKRF